MEGEIFFPDPPKLLCSACVKGIHLQPISTLRAAMEGSQLGIRGTQYQPKSCLLESGEPLYSVRGKVSSSYLSLPRLHNKVPQPGKLKKQKSITSQFWKLKSEIKVSAGSVPPAAVREGAIPGLSPSLVDGCPLSVFTPSSLYMCLSIQISSSLYPLHKDTSHIGLGSMLMASF